MMMAYFIKNEKQNFSSDIMAARNTDFYKNFYIGESLCH